MPALRTRDTHSRSALEVTTDAPLQPPALAIISPTPRAFTFPFNKADQIASPYSSPSSSPFEPELKPFTPSPPSLLRTLSPVSATSSSSYSVSSPSTSHKRRKSSISSDIEHRPKKGDEDYIKRPENAFILFRRHCCEARQAAADEADTPAKKQRQADLSKTISQQWKGLNAEERQIWEDRAKEKKKEHEQLHPNYVYRPQRAKGKKAAKKCDEDTDTNISFMLPLSAPMATRHGRSASAPTPPLGYQSIQLPNVYMPSCPTSPSMMGRRSSHPGHSEERSSHFDYLPNETLMPPTFSGPYESNMPAPQFYMGMFDQTPLGDRQNNLGPLTMPEPSMMISPHDLTSPASGYSSPMSPASGPYTPVQHPAHHHQFTLPQDVDEHSGYLGEPAQAFHCSSPMDLNIEYPEALWGDSHMWGGGQEILLGEDFDLNAIPPIELGHADKAFQGELSYQLDASAAAMQEYNSHDPFALAYEYHHPEAHGPQLDGQGAYDATYYGNMNMGF